MSVTGWFWMEIGQTIKNILNFYFTTQIVTTHSEPFHSRSTLSNDENYLLGQKIDEYLNADLIRYSHSPYSSNAYVKPIDDRLDLYVDFTELNSITIDSLYAIQPIFNIINSICESNLFSKLVIKDAYHQIGLDEKAMGLTAFTTNFGTYEFTVMHHGMKNAENYLQALMDNVLMHVDKNYVKCYQGQILVHTTNFDHHFSLLKTILKELKFANLKIDIEESCFLTNHLKFQGYQISPLGVLIHPDKQATIANFLIPKTKQEVKLFLNLVNDYKEFVLNFDQLAQPLLDILDPEFEYYWRFSEQYAFDSLKNSLICAKPISFIKTENEFKMIVK